jgi:hypothetical protein
MYGLRVLSDLRLPFAALVDGSAAAPDVVVRRAPSGEPAPRPEGAPLAMSRCEHGDPSAIRYAGPGGGCLWTPALTCVFSPDGRQMDVYPRPEYDQEVIGLVLACQVAIFLLQRLGYPTLHASAVVVDGEAVVFLGHPGQGKSTLASSLLIRGAALLTDDALPLRLIGDRVYGAPGPPFMKLWEATAVHGLRLRADELPPVAANHHKKLLGLFDGRYASAQEPAAIRAVYLIRRFDLVESSRSTIAFEPLAGRAALAALLEQTSPSACLHGTEWAGVLRLYGQLAGQARVAVLRYPTGFQHQTTVYERIMADIEQAGRVL